jgi:carboxyl-terminal processing protease
VVHDVPAGSAAARAGLHVGDVVLAIDGTALAGRRQDEVVAQLRGEVGTSVVLRVRRDGNERDVAIERAPYRRASE